MVVVAARRMPRIFPSTARLGGPNSSKAKPNRVHLLGVSSPKKKTDRASCPWGEKLGKWNESTCKACFVLRLAHAAPRPMARPNPTRSLGSWKLVGGEDWVS